MAQNFEWFGKYILLEKIATGGMAEVYLAKKIGAERIGKLVAIKRILPQFTENPEYIDMFKSEAKIAIHLSHSNIVSIHEFGVENGQFFLAMDYVEGRNLRQIINKMKKEGVSFSIEQILYIVKEVAAGLDHAHRCLDSSSGKPLLITHRDMSPQNVMINFEGEVKVVDFGIAKAETQLESTRAGTLKGKFGYMSPEQAEGELIDLRTDIFSLGIVLWELLANDRLFVANNEMNTLRKIRDCQIPSLRKINPQISTELERICNKALQKDRNQRYQTSAGFHRELNRYLNHHYPDFLPHDFSVFIKTLFTKEITEDRKKLVDYSRSDFSQPGSPGAQEVSSTPPAQPVAPVSQPPLTPPPAPDTIQITPQANTQPAEERAYEDKTEISQPSVRQQKFKIPYTQEESTAPDQILIQPATPPPQPTASPNFGQINQNTQALIGKDEEAEEESQVLPDFSEFDTYVNTAQPKVHSGPKTKDSPSIPIKDTSKPSQLSDNKSTTATNSNSNTKGNTKQTSSNTAVKPPMSWEKATPSNEAPLRLAIDHNVGKRRGETSHSRSGAHQDHTVSYGHWVRSRGERRRRSTDYLPEILLGGLTAVFLTLGVAYILDPDNFTREAKSVFNTVISKTSDYSARNNLEWNNQNPSSELQKSQKSSVSQVKVSINSTPPNAEVWINGHLLPDLTPTTFDFEPMREYNVLIKKENFARFEMQYVYPKSGEKILANLPRAQLATLDIIVVGAGEIYINGKRIASSGPVEGYQIPANETIVVRSYDPVTGASAEESVRVAEGRPKRVVLYPKTQDNNNRPPVKSN